MKIVGIALLVLGYTFMYDGLSRQYKFTSNTFLALLGISTSATPPAGSTTSQTYAGTQLPNATINQNPNGPATPIPNAKKNSGVAQGGSNPVTRVAI